MNPLAQELNDIIQRRNSNVLAMLSRLGKDLYFPKGILSQSAEAGKKAHTYNATIGIATDDAGPMYLPCIQEHLTGIEPGNSYTYAPAEGKPQLREKWREKQLADNPTLRGKSFGQPVVTCGLTHGLDLVSDLLVDKDDIIVLPDKFWENYTLIFELRSGARFLHYPLFDNQGSFNVPAFQKAVNEAAAKKSKIIMLFNFPNNPTGYTITPAEAVKITEVIRTTADQGTNCVVVLDDAYFGLFFDDHIMQESLFGALANLHPRVLTVKLDGPTKEQFVWGFRIGFLTFGISSAEGGQEIYTALEQKTKGAIRAGISNCSHPAQTIILKALNSPAYAQERDEKVAILKKRALKVREVLAGKKFEDIWEAYPFNSGYFMCLRLKAVEAETLRKYLLDQYGVGTIAMDTWDLRVAFSSIAEKDIPDLFATIAKAAQELMNRKE
nr:aminotransferase class I/II-fold pyridoxal phosphate-dependent enzyme [Deltaproteobacteria bacterium]